MDITCGGCRCLGPGRPGVCTKYGLNLSGTLERLEVCKKENGKETVCENCGGVTKTVNGKEKGHHPAC